MKKFNILLISLLPLTSSCAQPKKKHDRITVTIEKSPSSSQESNKNNENADDYKLAPDEAKKLATARIDAQLEQVELRQDWTKLKIAVLTGVTSLVGAGIGVGISWLSGKCK